MKKFLALCLVFVLTFALCACGMTDAPQTTTPTTTAPTTTNTQPSSVVTMPTLDSNIPDPTVNNNSDMGDMLPGVDDSMGSGSGQNGGSGNGGAGNGGSNGGASSNGGTQSSGSNNGSTGGGNSGNGNGTGN